MICDDGDDSDSITMIHPCDHRSTISLNTVFWTDSAWQIALEDAFLDIATLKVVAANAAFTNNAAITILTKPP